MDLVSNKDFLIEEIERSAQQEIDRLDASAKQELEALERSAAADLERELSELREEQNAKLEQTRKRLTSAHELQMKRDRLEAEAKLRERITDRIRATLREDNERSRAIAQEIIASLNGRIEGPKWLDLKNVEASLDTFTFRAHQDDGSYLEVTEQDVLSSLEPSITEAIRKR